MQGMMDLQGSKQQSQAVLKGNVALLTWGDAMEGSLVPWQGLPVLSEARDSGPIRSRPSRAQEGLQHSLVQGPQPVHQPGVAACWLKQAAQQTGELLCEWHRLQATAVPAR